AHWIQRRRQTLIDIANQVVGAHVDDRAAVDVTGRRVEELDVDAGSHSQRGAIDHQGVDVGSQLVRRSAVRRRYGQAVVAVQRGEHVGRGRGGRVVSKARPGRPQAAEAKARAANVAVDVGHQIHSL